MYQLTVSPQLTVQLNCAHWLTFTVTSLGYANSMGAVKVSINTKLITSCEGSSCMRVFNYPLHMPVQVQSVIGMSISIYVIIASAINMLMIYCLIYWRHASGRRYILHWPLLFKDISTNWYTCDFMFPQIWTRFSGLVIVMQSLLYNQIISIFFLFFEHNHTPSGKKTDWNAGGNYIPNANYRVQVEGHFVTDVVCACVAVTTLPQSSSSAWRVVLNVPVGMLIGDRSAVQLRLRGLSLCE